MWSQHPAALANWMLPSPFSISAFSDMRSFLATAPLDSLSDMWPASHSLPWCERFQHSVLGRTDRLLCTTWTDGLGGLCGPMGIAAKTPSLLGNKGLPQPANVYADSCAAILDLPLVMCMPGDSA